jgi:GrpB-like predicted nucleotidyltransferase (UPF0157 family)
VIDIDVLVPSPADVPAAIARLDELGYVHRGDLGLPGREAFFWPEGESRHHLYVIVEGHREHLKHVRFRDHLRSHPADVEAYSSLKRMLAAQYGSDRDGYTEAKSEFVEGVLADAGS